MRGENGALSTLLPVTKAGPEEERMRNDPENRYLRPSTYSHGGMKNGKIYHKGISWPPLQVEAKGHTPVQFRKRLIRNSSHKERRHAVSYLPDAFVELSGEHAVGKRREPEKPATKDTASNSSFPLHSARAASSLDCPT